MTSKRRCRKYGFNPRSRGGSDTPRASIPQGGAAVSIHAPVVGATRFADSVYQSDLVSIHAPVVGATLTSIR